MRWSVVFVFCLATMACGRPPDADAIRAAILDMASAAQAQRSGDLLAYISDDFTANAGEFDRARFAQMLRAQLLARRAIKVDVGRIEIELSGNRATARFSASLADPSGRWFEGQRKMLDFVTGWRLESGQWRCYNASWKDESD